MIKIEGLALERLLNAASREGVRLWGVRRCSPTVMTAKLSPQDFYVLRRLRRRLGCKIHILEKHGAVFAAGRLRLRKVLLFGWIPLLLAIMVLSRYVWIVDVVGCYRVAEEDVYALLDEMGVRPGVPAGDLDHYAISRALSAQDGRIAWAGASRKGVVLTVEIVEAEQIPEKPEKEAPGSIYAAKDAVVKKITALKGRTMVSEGQTVKKGDLLITGELTSDAGIPYQVTARGEVLSRVMYVVTAEVGQTAVLPARSEENVHYCRVSLAGKELFPIPEEYRGWEFEEESCSTLNCLLPLVVKSGRLWRMTEQEVALTLQEQEARALRLAEEKAIALLPQTARVMGKRSEITRMEDGSVRAILSIETEEDIASLGPLDVKNTDTQDGE